MAGATPADIYFLNTLKLADVLEQGGRTFTLLPFIVWTRAAVPEPRPRLRRAGLSAQAVLSRALVSP
jgi:hypothetical protein